MASHQISIRHDVYEQLKKSKLPNESFSDTISRLLSKDSNVKSVLNLYGAAVNNKNNDDHNEELIILNSYKEAKKEIRKSFSSRFT